MKILDREYGRDNKDYIAYIPPEKPETQAELNDFVWKILANHLPHCLGSLQQDIKYVKIHQVFMLTAIGIILALNALILALVAIHI